MKNHKKFVDKYRVIDKLTEPLEKQTKQRWKQQLLIVCNYIPFVSKYYGHKAIKEPIEAMLLIKANNSQEDLEKVVRNSKKISEMVEATIYENSYMEEEIELNAIDIFILTQLNNMVEDGTISNEQWQRLCGIDGANLIDFFEKEHQSIRNKNEDSKQGSKLYVNIKEDIFDYLKELQKTR